MKKYLLLPFLAIGILFASCNKDFDLTKPLDGNITLFNGYLVLPLGEMQFGVDSLLNLSQMGPEFQQDGNSYKVSIVDSVVQFLDFGIAIPLPPPIEVNKEDIITSVASLIPNPGIPDWETFTATHKIDVAVNGYPPLIQGPILFDVPSFQQLGTEKITFKFDLPKELIDLNEMEFKDISLQLGVFSSGFGGAETDKPLVVTVVFPEQFELYNDQGAPVLSSTLYLSTTENQQIPLKVRKLNNRNNPKPYQWSFDIDVSVQPCRGLKLTNAHPSLHFAINFTSPTSKIDFTKVVGRFNFTGTETSTANIGHVLSNDIIKNSTLITHNSNLNLTMTNPVSLPLLVDVTLLENNGSTPLFSQKDVSIPPTGVAILNTGSDIINRILKDKVEDIKVVVSYSTDQQEPNAVFYPDLTRDLKVKYGVDIPFSFAPGSKIMVTTDIKDVFSSDFAKFTDGLKASLQLNATATNDLPYEMLLSLTAVSADQTPICVLAQNVTVKAAQPNPFTGMVDDQGGSASVTSIEIPLDNQSVIQKLKDAKDIKAEFKLSPNASATFSTISSTAKVKLKMSALKKNDGGYTIDIANSGN